MNPYEYFSGVTSRTSGCVSSGGEFKLLYGNREKIDRTSYLSKYVFKDIANKIPNMIFSETLEDNEEGYIQNTLPSAGNDFKLLYGNREKVNEATDKALFLFSELDERPLIENVNMVSVAEPVYCGFYGSDECTASGRYTIETDNDTSKYQYLWTIESGNAEIIGDYDTGSVVVETTSHQHEAFTLKCSIIDDMEASVALEQSFTQYRWTHVEVIGIDEISNQSCEPYGDGNNGSCVASSIYRVEHNDTGFQMFYGWDIEPDLPNLSIVSGQATNQITVESTGNDEKIDFTVSCTVKDQYTSDTKTISSSHTRISDVTINDIEFISGGSCNILSGETSCEAFGEYKVDSNGGNTYKWTVNGGTIETGSGTDTITVKTVSGEGDVDIDITCLVSNPHHSATMTKTFTHHHMEEVFDSNVVYDSTNIATEFVA